MTQLHLILADQLSASISALERFDKLHDMVVMFEVNAETTYVWHHPKKIAFLFSAMRHFAETLRQEGYRVHYSELDDPANTQNLTSEIQRIAVQHNAKRIVCTEPGEWRVLQLMQAWEKDLGIACEIRPDTRFLCNHETFAAWVKDKKQLRMEFFYREMRKKYRILLEADGMPTGGKWNYDAQNRKPPAKGLHSPKRISHRKDGITKDVLALVMGRFSEHFGALEPFHYAVTREQALMELTHFIDKLLPMFGDYQDAMVAGEAYLYHSLLSSYLNAGLLLPLEICEMAEHAYRRGHAPLNAAEGFIRQILGWREYVRGIYWHFMPDYAERNFFNAHRPLPEFYWTGKTDMFCMGEAIGHTRDHAYSHHIQRLMITGNFALLAGLDVKQVCEWYLAVYSDAYEWVELPNTLGMALFADGGLMASKPYAASGKYINRMSNYCKQCRYDPDKTTGADACPFNSLYWDFIARNEAKLKNNPRMAYPYTNWSRMSADKKSAILQQAETFLDHLSPNT